MSANDASDRPAAAKAKARRFTVWAAGDSHITTDLKEGRRSLADAIEQSESPQGFDWDIMLDCGDTSASQSPPDDEEGKKVVEQYHALRKHHRSQVYNIAGNHDASGPDEPMAQWWFQKYLDPLGEHTRYSGVDSSRRPFSIEGAWDHYAFTFGNVRVLMMSDRNDGGPPVGRGHGGYPAGAVAGETFDWWVDQVETHQDKIIICMHHHMLKETTVASGPWEGFGERDKYGRYRGNYHGYFRDGGPMGASYLYWVDGNPDAQSFERYLAAHPGVIDLWIGGHTHAHPDDTTGGRSHVERKWGVTFLNCCALTRYHVRKHATPMSRVLDFIEGDDELPIRCYMHSDEFLPQGWYDKAARVVPLRHAFSAPEKTAAGG